MIEHQLSPPVPRQVQCATCVHFYQRAETTSCAAFPEWIPVDIIMGRANHAEPYPGDGGVQYEEGEPQHLANNDPGVLDLCDAETEQPNPATDTEIASWLDDHDGWTADGGTLTKLYVFDNRRIVAGFVQEVMDHANAVNHHPNIIVTHEEVHVAWRTRASDAITALDFECAAYTDTASQNPETLSLRLPFREWLGLFRLDSAASYKAWESRVRGQSALKVPEFKAWQATTEHSREPRPRAIFVRKVKDAIPLILAGNVVELANPRKVNTLLGKLAKIAKDAEKKGEAAPHYDLCNVTVDGASFFCAGKIRTKEFPAGVPRLAMPQLGGETVPGSAAHQLPHDDKNRVDAGPEFIDHLQRSGIHTTSESVKADHLIASQAQLVGEKIAKRVANPRYKPSSPIFISRDNYIIDGHHRWATQVAKDAEDNKLGDISIRVIRIDAPITEILPRAIAWSAKFGMKPAAGAPTPGHRLAAPFDAETFTLDHDASVRAWETRRRNEHARRERGEPPPPRRARAAPRPRATVRPKTVPTTPWVPLTPAGRPPAPPPDQPSGTPWWHGTRLQKLDGGAITVSGFNAKTAVATAVLGDRHDPAHLAGAMLQSVTGDLTVTVRTEPGGYRPASVSIRATDGAGLNITRDFYRHPNGDLTVHHSYFEIPEDRQGQGLAKSVLKDSMTQYEGMGLKSIDMLANLDVGGYAWAKFGYKAASPARMAHTMEYKLEEHNFTDHQREAIRTVINEHRNDPKLPWHLAGLTDGSNTIGKTLMLNTNWDAKFDLDDHESVKRFKAYVK